VKFGIKNGLGGDGCGMGYTYVITETGAEKLSKIDLARELLGDEK
jgi:hypothetical protein